MTRHIVPPFQIDRPIFVKQSFQANGKMWEVGQIFNWKEFGVDYDRILSMYNSDFFFHDDELAAARDEKMVGDGLLNLEIEALHELVDAINIKVKAKTRTEKEYTQKKCGFSKIRDKQIGYIRRWRITYSNRFE